MLLDFDSFCSFWINSFLLIGLVTALRFSHDEFIYLAYTAIGIQITVCVKGA
jgi:hypothetical protein